ncbi:MAG: hypothetical protein ACI8PZ_001333 [Myxococcota bacterium]|jgi:hypothetical protein
MTVLCAAACLLLTSAHALGTATSPPATLADTTGMSSREDDRRLSAPGPRGRHGFPTRKVAAMEVTLDGGPALPGTLVPGQPARLDITVENRRGHTLSTRNRSLRRSSRRVVVAVEGGTWDPVTGTVIAHRPSAQTARVAAVQIDVTYLGRPDLDQHRTLRIDWRAVLGPDPSEVTALTVAPMSSGLLDGWLLPGSPLALEVRATDHTGRSYSTAPEAALQLPWDRLTLETAGLEGGSGEHRAMEASVPRGGYSARVAFTGSDHAESLTWKADFQRRDGPGPRDVRALSWTLEAPAGSPPGKAPLGATLPLQVTVTTREGRTFPLRSDGPLRLPADRLVVRTRHATWDPERAEVSLDPTLSAGQRYSVEVRYQGRSDLGGRQTLRPDYLAAIGPWAAPDAEKELGHVGGGAPGSDGRPGRGGRAGRAGAAASDDSDVGGRGERGGDGARGEDGAPGAIGRHVQVHATVGWTVDRSERVVLYRVADETGASAVRVKRWHQAPVILLSRGGAGGAGGAGGTGGPGGAGGGGCRSGDGGDGGRGGDSGIGAEGGPGGQVTLVVSSPDLYRHFELRSVGGAGGVAGAAGGAGKAGKSPSFGSLVGAVAGLVASLAGDAPTDAPECDAGDPGRAGGPGRAGSPGRAGGGGTVHKKVAGDVLAQIGELPPEVAAVLVLP